MIQITAPKTYYNEYGIISSSGPLLAELGKKFFIIYGEKAWEAGGPRLVQALEGAGLSFQRRRYGGMCTPGDIRAVAAAAREAKVDALISLGGGKVTDLAKAAADEAGLPIVTIPSIPSNCACYTPLSVLYNDAGAYQGSRILKKGPALVLVDPALIACSPRRFLAAGMGDTLAKYLEARDFFAPDGEGVPSDTNEILGISIAKQAWDAVMERREDAFSIMEAARGNSKGPEARAFQKLLDAIFFLAGLIGSMRGGSYVQAYIHPLGDAFTVLDWEGGKVHGEVIAFCNAVQMFLYHQEALASDLLAFNRSLGLPASLDDFGCPGSDRKENALVLSETFDWQEVSGVSHPFSPGELREAILSAHGLGRG